MIDALIEAARKEPNYNNVSRVIKIVKQLFNNIEKDDKNEDDKPDVRNQNKDSLVRALNTAEYRKMFDFFVTECADLVLKVCNVDISVFDAFDEQLLKTKKNTNANAPQTNSLDLKKAYGGCTSKQSMLLKTFAANYNKLLQQSIDNASGAHLSNQ